MWETASSSTALDTFVPIVAAGAALSVASLAILQTDRISRWTLPPSRLMAKRRQEYTYQWKTAIEKVNLQLDYCLAGGSEKFNADPEINLKNCEFVNTPEEYDQLIRRIIAGGQELKGSVNKDDETFTALKLDRDPSDPSGDFYLFLKMEKHHQDDNNNNNNNGSNMELFQVALVPFCQKLQKAFENQLTTTALCFVADASSGKASGMLEELMVQAKTNVAVISEPLWMVMLARLAEAKIYATSKLESILFSLCRLDAWALREEAKASHTIMITLPGQATVATLLPLVQSVFPEDRHVFAYDGCVSSVVRGVQQSSQYSRGTLHTEIDTIVTKLAQNPVRHTTPLPTNSPLTKSLFNLDKSLSDLPVSQARVVESWMSSVDAFFKVKGGEAKNGYLPYVFKLSFLTDSSVTFEPSTQSFWSLSSLLQFITGTKSRPVPEGVMDSAREFLKDYNSRDENNYLNESPVTSISESTRKAIENCVFQHKSILIGNKTLQDTVLPIQHWTLKQASRAGCSCCGPDPYEQMEDEDESSEEASGMRTNLNTPGAFATMRPSGDFKAESASSFQPKKKTGYVDGKMGFAFDPTKFS